MLAERKMLIIIRILCRVKHLFALVAIFFLVLCARSLLAPSSEYDADAGVGIGRASVAMGRRVLSPICTLFEKAHKVSSHTYTLHTITFGALGPRAEHWEREIVYTLLHSKRNEYERERPMSRSLFYLVSFYYFFLWCCAARSRELCSVRRHQLTSASDPIYETANGFDLMRMRIGEERTKKIYRILLTEITTIMMLWFECEMMWTICALNGILFHL